MSLCIINDLPTGDLRSTWGRGVHRFRVDNAGFSLGTEPERSESPRSMAVIPESTPSPPDDTPSLEDPASRRGPCSSASTPCSRPGLLMSPGCEPPRVFPVSAQIHPLTQPANSHFQVYPLERLDVDGRSSTT